MNTTPSPSFVCKSYLEGLMQRKLKTNPCHAVSYYVPYSSFTEICSNINLFDLYQQLTSSSIPVKVNYIKISDYVYEFNFTRALTKEEIVNFNDFVQTYTTPEYGNNVIYIGEVKAPKISGGDFIAGDWRARMINVTSGNQDTCVLSPENGTFTLKQGKYYIFAMAQGNECGNHKIRLYDVDEKTNVATGEEISAVGDENSAVLSVCLQIDHPKTYQIQHQCNISRARDGFGKAICSDDLFEMYSCIRITPIKKRAA
jgi:hypothetical protein